MLSLKRNLEEQAAHSALASTPQTTASVIDNASSASGSSKKTSSFYEDYKKRKPSAEPGKMFSLGLTNDFSKKLQKAFENAGKKEKEKPAEKTTFPKNGTDGVITTGNAIKSNIINVLSKKYGELDIRHMFDGIDDKDIEDNISTAENTINTNIDRGFLDKDYSKKLPNLRDGLALSYAAASKGNNKAATKARDAAYTADETPLVNDTGIKLMSNTSKTPKLPTNIHDVFKIGQRPAINGIEPDGKRQSNKDVEKDVTASNKTAAGSTNQSKSVNTDTYNYLNKKSTTLEKYEPKDIVKDYLAPSMGLFDVVENIKKGDFISALIDPLRMSGTTSEANKDVARSIWKAGSEVYLRPRGFNVSADMLEHSLQEKPCDVVFYEDSDIVKKIKNDEGFKKHLDDVVRKIENNVSLSKDDKSYEFKSDNDLLFSLHWCNLAVDDIKYNLDGTKDIAVHLSDSYDYTEILTAMNEGNFDPTNISFGGLANDLGTITSKYDAINTYEVDIYFVIRR